MVSTTIQRQDRCLRRWGRPGIGRSRHGKKPGIGESVAVLIQSRARRRQHLAVTSPIKPPLKCAATSKPFWGLPSGASGWGLPWFGPGCYDHWREAGLTAKASRSGPEDQARVCCARFESAGSRRDPLDTARDSGFIKKLRRRGSTAQDIKETGIRPRQLTQIYQAYEDACQGRVSGFCRALAA